MLKLEIFPSVQIPIISLTDSHQICGQQREPAASLSTSKTEARTWNKLGWLLSKVSSSYHLVLRELTWYPIESARYVMEIMMGTLYRETSSPTRPAWNTYVEKKERNTMIREKTRQTSWILKILKLGSPNFRFSRQLTQIWPVVWHSQTGRALRKYWWGGLWWGKCTGPSAWTDILWGRASSPPDVLIGDRSRPVSMWSCTQQLNIRYLRRQVEIESCVQYVCSPWLPSLVTRLVTTVCMNNE